mgnify:CR=1 FL=1
MQGSCRFSCKNCIKKNFRYVGKDFAYEARSIHYKNKKKDKGIYGTASKEEIRELKEEVLCLSVNLCVFAFLTIFDFFLGTYGIEEREDDSETTERTSRSKDLSFDTGLLRLDTSMSAYFSSSSEDVGLGDLINLTILLPSVTFSNTSDALISS